ncbi:hypothetical protein LTR29_007710 [Friedmanniomyces endolithicus]|nr:hypothetical protein LTR29_007710 [Friedmanniomyces endolithicus]
MTFNSNSSSGDQSPVTPSPRRHQALREHATHSRATEAPLELTLGIEIECILAHCTFPSRSLTNGLFVQHSSLGKDVVTNALSVPMQANCSSCGEIHLIKLPVRQPIRRTESDNTYTTWEVTDDISIWMSEDEKTPLGNNIKYFDFYSIEIRSRILSADTPLQTTPSESDPEHIHSIGYDEEINAVLSHLNKTFNTSPTNNFTLLTNHSCGMHVHVGNGKEGFPLQTVKNMLATYYACESAIDTLHASDRIGGSGIPCLPSGLSYVDISTGCFESLDPPAYNPPMSAVHAQAVYSRRREAALPDRERSMHYQVQYPESHFDSDPEVKDAAFQFTTKAALALIEAAPNVRALQELQAGHTHACTVNLENLRDFRDFDAHDEYRSPKMTVEFRQATSTLHSDEVLAWIDVLVQLTRHAHATPAKAFAKLATNFLSPRFSALNLLTTIGCTRKTLSHYNSKVAHSASLAQIIAHTTQPAHVDAASVYHDDLFARETRVLDSWQGYNPFRKLQLWNLRDRLATLHRGAINRRILKKFLAGGYGQFADAHLNALDFSEIGGDAARQRLRIGWVNSDVPVDVGYNAYAPGEGIAVGRLLWTPPTPVGTRRAQFIGCKDVDEARALREGEEGDEGKGKGKAAFLSEEVEELRREMSSFWSNTADEEQVNHHSRPEDPVNHPEDYPFDHPDDYFHPHHGLPPPINHPNDSQHHSYGLPPPEPESPAPDWFLPPRPTRVSPSQVLNYEAPIADPQQQQLPETGEDIDDHGSDHGSYEGAQHIEFAEHHQAEVGEADEVEEEEDDEEDEVLPKVRQMSPPRRTMERTALTLEELLSTMGRTTIRDDADVATAAAAADPKPAAPKPADSNHADADADYYGNKDEDDIAMYPRALRIAVGTDVRPEPLRIRKVPTPMFVTVPFPFVEVDGDDDDDE